MISSDECAIISARRRPHERIDLVINAATMAGVVVWPAAHVKCYVNTQPSDNSGSGGTMNNAQLHELLTIGYRLQHTHVKFLTCDQGHKSHKGGMCAYQILEWGTGPHPPNFYPNSPMFSTNLLCCYQYRLLQMRS